MNLFHEIHGEGEPLVLLNGIMMTTASWAAETRVLSTRYRCVLHDFRGQLRSDKPPGPYAMSEHVDDLAALLDRLGIESAHLAGTSYGGEVAMLFALAHPARVRSLSLIACVSHVEPPLRATIETWAATARSRPDDLYGVSAPDNFSPAFLARRPEFVTHGRARLRTYEPEFFRAFTELCDAFNELDVTARLHEIHCPTLVVCGEHDALKPPSYSRTIARAIPGAEFLMVADAGHAVVIEKPDEVNTALLGFLAKLH